MLSPLLFSFFPSFLFPETRASVCVLSRETVFCPVSPGGRVPIYEEPARIEHNRAERTERSAGGGRCTNVPRQLRSPSTLIFINLLQTSVNSTSKHHEGRGEENSDPLPVDEGRTHRSFDRSCRPVKGTKEGENVALSNGQKIGWGEREKKKKKMAIPRRGAFIGYFITRRRTRDRKSLGEYSTSVRRVSRRTEENQSGKKLNITPRSEGESGVSAMANAFRRGGNFGCLECWPPRKGTVSKGETWWAAEGSGCTAIYGLCHRVPRGTRDK